MTVLMYSNALTDTFRVFFIFIFISITSCLTAKVFDHDGVEACVSTFYPPRPLHTFAYEGGGGIKNEAGTGGIVSHGDSQFAMAGISLLHASTNPSVCIRLRP